MVKQNDRELKEELEDSEDDRWMEWKFKVMFPIVKMERLKKEQMWKKNKNNRRLAAEIRDVKLQIEAEWEEIQTWAGNIEQQDFIKEYKLLIEAKERGIDTSKILKRYIDILSTLFVETDENHQEACSA